MTGLGGRQGGPAVGAGGGGYPGTCTATAFGLRPADPAAAGAAPPDPRLQDLAEAGISPAWRAIADLIGFDRYMVATGLWLRYSDKALDEHRINLPALRRFAERASAPFQFPLLAATGASDPRTGDLHDVGVPLLWQRLAALVGFDVWCVVVGLAYSLDPRAAATQRISAPPALALYRCGRDALVRQLYADGVRARALRKFVQQALGEELTRMRIYQVLANG